MSFINYMAREINCKLVYYGPGLCGKTTNLQYIYERTNPEHKGKMISLATETERTLFFDFLPLSLGEIRGFKTRFHLYTVPGQVFYDASRKLILKGVDGVIFVADSQIERMEANEESMENLRTNLAEQGYSILEAKNSEEALAQCKTQKTSPISLMICDLLMTEMSGVELAGKARSYHPRMKTLYLSAHSESSMIIRGIPLTDISFLPKPFKLKELISSVNELLSRTSK